MKTTVHNGPRLHASILALCAVRLDANTSAEQFVAWVNKVVEAAKDEREDELARLDSP